MQAAMWIIQNIVTGKLMQK